MKLSNITISRSAVALVTAVFACAACTDDWDEHYDAAVSDSGTLWQAISSQDNLTNFTRVIQACGYDKTLNGSQTFSVFAPVDADFTSEQADELISSFNEQERNGVKDEDNTVVRQFVQNHISLYSHPVSSLTNDSISMMNGKYKVLTQSMLGDSKLSSANHLYSNGVLFTLDKQVEYFPNVYEYLGLDGDVDSVYNFLNQYSVYKFDPDKSVAGGIEDGLIVYLDSVTVLNNAIFNKYGLINNEDSSYLFLAPTNDEWNRMVAEYEPWFNYDNTVNKRDSIQFTNSRLSVISGSFFSRTTNPDQAIRDSAVSTSALSWQMRHYREIDDAYGTYYKPYEAGGVFDGTEAVECSNGQVLKASRYNVQPTQNFLQTIKVEAESILTQDSIAYAEDPLTVCDVATDNPFFGKISGNSFVEIVPENTSVNPIVMFGIPDVLSNVPYDVYVVTAPVIASDTLAAADKRLPVRMQVKLGYNDQNGKNTLKQISGYFVSTPDVVDTILVAEKFQFPTCSYGLSDYQVQIQLLSRVTSGNLTKWTRTMRIDCFILKPRYEATEEAAKNLSNN